MCGLFVCDLVIVVLAFTCVHVADIRFERTNRLQKILQVLPLVRWSCFPAGFFLSCLGIYVSDN